MTSPVTNGSNTDTDIAGKSSASSITSAATQQQFLQLLVAQIKHQDPLNPTDSTQFMTQLTQFSQLEQLLGIHADLDAISQAAAPASPDATTKPAAGSGSN